MFRIFTSNRQHSFLLFDHSALKLTTALLQDDLDDRMDALREVLEQDPFLATWLVQSAAQHDIQLTSLHSATRWLNKHFLALANPNTLVSATESATRLQTWCSVLATSISAARHARELAKRNRASDDAYWYTLLCCCNQQLDALANLNGQSPLHGVTWTVPSWLQELHASVNHATDRHDAKFAAKQAIQLTSSHDRRWLSYDELTTIVAPQPLADQLVPALFSRLRRLDDLETSFTETLQREKMASMQQLAYGASHEINNPLANISTRAQSLMQNEHDADRRRKLQAINQQAFRAYEMIADLMLFAKPPKLQTQIVHLNALVSQIRDEFEVSQTDVMCRVVGCETPLTVLGDETQLAVAIQAVCQNGAEAMGGRGELLVELAITEDQRVAISIKDSGPGLTPLARRHLFDPFFSGREAGRGMGFGLSKAWRIIEEHRGRISVSSVPEHGSCFTITLPMISTDAHV